ncbi:hypothetical protein [Rossellomorea marisflavi]|uniref:hypothetical protein n=2 Tax=Rossellomorea marisflavi TaxID=189381 RepID=UPI003514BF13
MVIEIFANICMSMISFIKGEPSEEKIEKNIERLAERNWFSDLYAQHAKFIQTDGNIRYIIGHAKVEKIIKNEIKEERLKADIIEALTV